MDLESKHGEKKAAFDRVTVGLAVEQSNIEKECDMAQVRSYFLFFILYICCLSPRNITR